MQKAELHKNEGVMLGISLIKRPDTVGQPRVPGELPHALRGVVTKTLENSGLLSQNVMSVSSLKGD